MSSSTSPGSGSSSTKALETLDQIHSSVLQCGLVHSSGVPTSNCVNPVALIDERIKVRVNVKMT